MTYLRNVSMCSELITEMKVWCKYVICLSVILVFCASCSTSSIFANKPIKSKKESKTSRKKAKENADFNLRLMEHRTQIIQYAEDFIGTNYRSGGTTPNGFDCSGFTSFVYDRFGVKLDHNSTGQSRQGKEVDLKMALPGDVIVFAKNGRIHHVGLIVEINENEIQIIHSCNSKGVAKENILNSKYWSSRIHSVRDVVSDDFANNYQD